MSKCIRDSVHGNIIVPNEYAKNIIDTPAFQRLRRVEQTAIRSIFPSARHDRFIHSLGVYNIGRKIVDNISKEDLETLKVQEDDWKRIINSYLIACLLHDISHAPFSHTFEFYYGPKEKLAAELKNILGKSLSEDLENIDGPNFHEYASAIVTIKEFSESIKELNGDIELVCRMIIGCYYEKKKEEHLIENCFIPLLHGDIVDADRLDYACRDVWASGYTTAGVDIDRLVAGIHIKYKQDDKEPVVCVDSKVLNEIVNMLEVRQFQNRYVINHHSVQYEQELMVRAAECTAENLTNGKKGVDALREIINIDNTIGAKKIGNYIINRLSDEDLLFLMKQDEDNKFYSEFSTRRYTRFALWKSPDEFYYYFPSVPRNANLERPRFVECIKSTLSEFCNPEDIIIRKVVYKEALKLSSLFVIVNGNIVRYTNIYPEYNINEGINRDICFYYVFVPKPKESNSLDEYRVKMINALKPTIMELYQNDDKNFTLLDNLLNIIEITYRDNNILGYDSIEKKREAILNANMNIIQFLENSGVKKYIDSMNI